MHRSRILPARSCYLWANSVIIGNQSGRVMALDLNDGSRLWTAEEAAYGPVWPVGGSVFLMSDRNRLIRLDAATGEFIWGQPLPLHTTERERKRAEIYAHFGPLLAGGRLVVASSDGLIRSFDPTDGKLLDEVDLPGGAARRAHCGGWFALCRFKKAGACWPIAKLLRYSALFDRPRPVRGRPAFYPRRDS